MRRLAVIVAVIVSGNGVSAQSFVTGKALYRERMALPPGAAFVATLEDVSRVGGKSEELGRVTLDNPGQPPFTFKIAYDAARIDQRSRYSVRARITLDGRLLFTTDQVYPVLTGGAGSDVSLVMQRVPDGPAAPAASAGPPYFGDWRVRPSISNVHLAESGRPGTTTACR